MTLRLIRCALLAAALTGPAGMAIAQDRVLSIGGSVTEIIHALGQGHRLVARDTTSTYPPGVAALPDVGYMRALSPEGVLSVAPDLIISEQGAGPPETIAVLKTARVPFVAVPEAYDRAGILAKVRAVGAALGVSDAAEALAAGIDADLAAAEAAAQDAAGAPKRVLFILSAANDRLMASGSGTAADAIIRMAGGVNAIDAFTGYRQLTDEVASVAAPDVILMMDRGGDHGADAADLFALPALATTPAAANLSLVRINGLLLLGFGPRTAEAVTALTAALYGH